jgi:3-dehydroquinate synthase
MNLGGLAASLIMRGIRFYYVPTTLTGQIDASMGSKQAINFKGAKNWLGMFNDPEFCYVNPLFLKTTSL